MIQHLLELLLRPVLEKIKAIFGPFSKAFALVGEFWTNLTTIGKRTESLINEIISEAQQWRSFRENINFRTKLVSLPAAVDHIKDFFDQIRTAWQAVLDLVQELRNKFNVPGNPTEEAEQAIKDIQNSGFKNLLEKFPRLAKGLEKVLGALALLLDALASISKAIDDLTAIVDATRAIREAVEEGGPLFLSQKNPRRLEHLDDGTPIKIRVGNLHS